MPKVVDHAQRRDEIALVACQVVAKYGFEQATVARIARAAGYTTGMVAHYFESKQEIILAALRLMLLRIEQRLMRERQSGEANLLEVLSEALAIDEQRFTECAFWMAFWGQVSADKKLRAPQRLGTPRVSYGFLRAASRNTGANGRLGRRRCAIKSCVRS